MENTKFRHLDLFSGIGGFALAASWVWGPDHEIVSFCEIEKFPQKILRKHWPAVPIHDDIKTLRGDNLGRIDLVSGGFPCQPYSVAGKQLGKEDDRALWPEMLRVIKEAKPRWVIGENVAGFVNMGLDVCLFDLESEGYETTAFIIPACSTGAQHKRERIWIIANNAGGVDRENTSKQTERQEQKFRESISRKTIPNTYQFNGDLPRLRASQAPQLESPEIFRNNVSNTNGTGRKTSGYSMPQGWEKKGSMPWHSNKCFEWNGWSLTESPVCGTDDGISSRVDRIKGLGNAIVPQVVVPIMECIKQIEESI